MKYGRILHVDWDACRSQERQDDTKQSTVTLHTAAPSYILSIPFVQVEIHT
jgi:hypothetical protein